MIFKQGLTIVFSILVIVFSQNAFAQIISPLPADNNREVVQDPKFQNFVNETKCYIEELEGEIQECCEAFGPYGIYRSCTSYTREIGNYCEKEKRNCRAVWVNGCGAPHVLNIVQLKNGVWVFVDGAADGGKGVVIDYPFPDPNKPPVDAYCKAYGITPCTCKLSVSDPKHPIDIIVIDKADVATCSTATKILNQDFAACEKCCRDYANIFPAGPQNNKWFDSCFKSCRTAYPNR